LTGHVQRTGIKEFINKELAPMLRGRNPLETEALWNQMSVTHNPEARLEFGAPL